MTRTRSVTVVAAMIVGVGLLSAARLIAVQRSQSPVATSTSHSRILSADPAVANLAATQRISIVVRASATLNPSTGLYTYSYTVSSDPSSQGVVDVFAITPVPRLLSMSAPTHWSAFRYLSIGTDSAVVWQATDTGTLPPGYVDTGNIPPSQFDIAAGDSLPGFSFVTPAPPLQNGANFYAQAFDTIPGGPDEPDESYSPPGLFEQGVTGATLGPGSAVGVRPSRTRTGTQLRAPVPNPARAFSTVTYVLDHPGDAELAVFASGGRRVRLLASGKQPAGTYAVSWNGRDGRGGRVPSGVYFYRFAIDEQRAGAQRVVQVQ